MLDQLESFTHPDNSQMDGGGSGPGHHDPPPLEELELLPAELLPAELLPAELLPAELLPTMGTSNSDLAPQARAAWRKSARAAVRRKGTGRA
jgi:hypothetical protein